MGGPFFKPPPSLRARHFLEFSPRSSRLRVFPPPGAQGPGVEYRSPPEAQGSGVEASGSSLASSPPVCTGTGVECAMNHLVSRVVKSRVTCSRVSSKGWSPYYLCYKNNPRYARSGPFLLPRGDGQRPRGGLIVLRGFCFEFFSRPRGFFGLCPPLGWVLVLWQNPLMQLMPPADFVRERGLYVCTYVLFSSDSLFMHEAHGFWAMFFWKMFKEKSKTPRGKVAIVVTCGDSFWESLQVAIMATLLREVLDFSLRIFRAKILEENPIT